MDQALLVEQQIDDGQEFIDLLISDGFDVRAAHGTAQGLSSMQERAELAGGELQIESAPGKGTAIRASFPAAFHTIARPRARADRATVCSPRSRTSSPNTTACVWW